MSHADITRLLSASRDGDGDAHEALIQFVYADLKRMARNQLFGESIDFTLSATALVNEAYLRLVGDAATRFNDRSHFFRLIGRTMRHIAVDHARARLAEKRGGGVHNEELHDNLHEDPRQASMICEIHDALAELEASDPRMVDVVECRFFMGLTEAETATALDCSRPTVSRLWARAKEELRELIER